MKLEWPCMAGVVGALVLLTGGSMFARAFSLFGTEPQNVRVSDFPPGRAQAGALSAGQRGLAIGTAVMAVAAWSDTREGTSNIYLAKSRDGGRTFGSNVRVNDVPGT